MDIRTAILKLGDKKGWIYRKDWEQYGGSQRIQPSNSTFLCAMYDGDAIVGVRWEPSKEDLTATDWEVE
ncbi:MAG: hypothetical protein LKF01_00300 [Lactobacillus sp.]|jgi:hypothetical protein|nr:hypothetical protein [Lactobacillus sp.]MCH4067984.1 hypothetical protein [Lactobacillus sp.]MCI1304060.1 hypothetical protein [Lactobacillus sp.]MCI1329914.1 hypothetical protein [Lactobacillus sp.]MCI1399514.1 hypothetical protein [Lactobacillus sp.]